jgi:hypothetical protein
LLSVNRLAQKDYKIQFGANGCKILQGDKIDRLQKKKFIFFLESTIKNKLKSKISEF